MQSKYLTPKFDYCAIWLLLGLILSTSGRLAATPLSQNIPSDLWVVPFDARLPAEMVLAESFQGLTGALLPKLWLDKRGGMSAVILEQLESEGTQVHRIASVWDLPEEFWQEVSGAIVYNLGTHSLNTAISLCGIWNAVAVDESILDQSAAHGLSILHDARGQSEDQIFSQYFDSFSRGIAVEQTEAKPGYLHDFAILNRAFTFYGFDSTFRRRVAGALGPGATIFGWGPREFTWISDFSTSASQGVAADWCVNLSAMSRLPVEIPSITPAAPDPPEQGERIVAFVLSDGDNIQWLTGGMPLQAEYFGNPWRGTFPMNWEISPLLPDLAPRVLKYFYENATDQDGFVAAGSPGYRYIHFEPDSPERPRGTVDAEQTAPYLDASHLSIVSVINDNNGTLDEVVPLLQLPQVDGVIYKPYSPYDGAHGETLCATDSLNRDKFAVAYKFLLWEGTTHPNNTPEAVAAAISQMPASPQWDMASYALINAHAWSFKSIGGPVEAVRRTIEMLPPNTRIVTIHDFFSLINGTFSCSGLPHPSVLGHRL